MRRFLIGCLLVVLSGCVGRMEVGTPDGMRALGDNDIGVQDPKEYFAHRVQYEKEVTKRCRTCDLVKGWFAQATGGTEKQ